MKSHAGTGEFDEADKLAHDAYMLHTLPLSLLSAKNDMKKHGCHE